MNLLSKWLMKVSFVIAILAVPLAGLVNVESANAAMQVRCF